MKPLQREGGGVFVIQSRRVGFSLGLYFQSLVLATDVGFGDSVGLSSYR